MAHHLVDFEQACDQCTVRLESYKDDATQSAPAVLIEASPNGVVRSRVVDETLLTNYIEKDFKVSPNRKPPTDSFDMQTGRFNSDNIIITRDALG
jgi:hypothetical protein